MADRSGSIAKSVEMKFAFAQGLPTEIDEVLMMSEEKNLSAFGQGSELRQDRLGAVVIEGDQQVIQNERHRLMIHQILIKRCQPKSEVELIASAVAQSFYRNLGLVRTNAHEDGKIVGVEIRAQAAKCVPGDGLENFA